MRFTYKLFYTDVKLETKKAKVKVKKSRDESVEKLDIGKNMNIFWHSHTTQYSF